MVIIENKEEKLGEGGGGAGQQPATTNTVKLMVKVIASHVYVHSIHYSNNKDKYIHKQGRRRSKLFW